MPFVRVCMYERDCEAVYMGAFVAVPALYVYFPIRPRAAYHTLCITCIFNFIRQIVNSTVYYLKTTSTVSAI